MASSNFIFSCSDVSTHDLVRGSVRLSLPKGMSFPWELPKVSDSGRRLTVWNVHHNCKPSTQMCQSKLSTNDLLGLLTL